MEPFNVRYHTNYLQVCNAAMTGLYARTLHNGDVKIPEKLAI